ncbi:hypothetical protein BDBG_16476 [Blastomyces gilchristii SLH14081]|uniref:Uncharacterized protein n=2 Tax=Blastomyces TaxID=229219 RepID=A0A179UEN8_BLAGS|nr:uncharacterized protein BDBG_16476 [Blastomyces gilchristii SLH14081]EGE77242.2 hypothetical protein BDDG_00179 [Blastomyces dermatitidis ATCC 18188]OAT05461.1 hypothetical protein BDBG_16476 [Blastomyces gilchristii SLH14081]
MFAESVCLLGCVELQITVPMNEYVASSCCVLCGEELIQQYVEPLTPNIKWFCSFRAGKSSLFTSDLTVMKVTFDPTEYPNRPKRSIQRSVTIYRSKRDLESIYCFHLACWPNLKADQLYLSATWRVPWHPLHGPFFPVNPYTDRFTLSRALNRLTTASHWKESTPSDEGRSSSDFSELTRLLRGILNRLPAEIVSLIWMYLQPCPA